MFRDFRIKDNVRYEFRNRLYYEAIEIVESDYLDGMRYGYYVEYVVSDYTTEKILIVDREPVKIPYMGYIYTKKVRSLGDELLYDLVRDYTYFNPNIDYIGLKKMTEHILKYNCIMRNVESSVNIGNNIEVPVFSFEQLFPIVQQLHKRAEQDECELVANVLVLYSKDSNLTKGQKISFSRKVLENLNSEMFGKIIHNTANQLIRENNYVKVTNPRIIKKAKHNKIKTSKTVSRHMQEDTKELIDKHNIESNFDSEISYDKYLDFLKIKHKSNSQITKELGISRTTALQYRDILKQVKIDKI